MSVYYPLFPLLTLHLLITTSLRDADYELFIALTSTGS